MTSLQYALRCIVASALVALAACDITTEPRPTAPGETAVVVNSISNSITVFAVDSPANATHIGLGGAGTPVGAALHGAWAAVPLGVVPAVAVVDLAAGVVVRSPALPAGSGATGAAFANDSIVVVGNPDRNTVSPVNVRTGAVGAEIQVGTYPHHIVAAGSKLYVLNAELEDFVPARAGTISVLARETLGMVGTIQLTGFNPGKAELGSDGRLYVLNAGSWGQNDGSLAVIDTASLTELADHTGFGDFPGSLALGTGGRVYVASFAYGIAVWHAGTQSFLRGPDDPVNPEDTAPLAAVATDADGRLYALTAGCSPPVADRAHRLTAAFAVDLSVEVGLCPTGIFFTRIPAH